MDRKSLQWIGGWNSELAKNSTVSDLVNKPFKITEDRSFKSIIRFKAIAAGVTLLEARKGIGAMVDYETLLKETNANYETLLEKANANYETLLEEANTKAVKNIVKCYYKLKQNDAVARAYVLNEYPDIDVKLLDRIISEIYGLQETHL